MENGIPVWFVLLVIALIVLYKGWKDRWIQRFLRYLRKSLISLIQEESVTPKPVVFDPGTSNKHYSVRGARLGKTYESHVLHVLWASAEILTWYNASVTQFTPLNGNHAPVAVNRTARIEEKNYSGNCFDLVIKTFMDEGTPTSLINVLDANRNPVGSVRIVDTPDGMMPKEVFDAIAEIVATMTATPARTELSTFVVRDTPQTPPYGYGYQPQNDGPYPDQPYGQKYTEDPSRGSWP
jgi:hypothetical protein